MNTPAPAWRPVPDAGMRLSDAERDVATTELGEHYAQGRLTKEEFEERTERIFAAKTRGEIPGLFADLPSRFAAPPPAPPGPAWGGRGPASAMRPPRVGPSRRAGGLPTPVVVLLVIVGLVILVNGFPFILAGLLIWFLVSRFTGHGRRAYAHGYHGHHGHRPRSQRHW